MAIAPLSGTSPRTPLAGSLEDARAAARARGKERNLALLLTPAVVNAVAYAQRTGEALHARGLPEDA